MESQTVGSGDLPVGAPRCYLCLEPVPMLIDRQRNLFSMRKLPVTVYNCSGLKSSFSGIFGLSFISSNG
jgi:hypothetical protein